MATFLVQQQELADRLNLDQTVSANATRLQRWLNLIQQDICSRRDWAFLEEREMVQTVVDKTAGTVTATASSGTVTGSSTAFASTDVRSFIQFSDTNNWYEVTAYSSATSITITPTFGGTTASGLTYILRKVYYPLSVNVSRILSIRQTITPTKLVNLGYRTKDLYRPNVQTTAPPRAYSLYRLDPDVAATAAKKLEIEFEPPADAVYNMEVRFLKILADLSASGDISQIPVRYHNTIIDGAEWLGAKYLNNPAEALKKEQYELGIKNMILEENSFDDYHPIIQSSDDTKISRYLPFPYTFEQPR